MNIDTSKLPLLDTDVLRTFVAIAECGSFTRAAAQVHRTPAALSMQIKRLEETIGKPVFRREPRQVRLTSEGEILLGYSRRLLKLNAEAVQQFLSPSLTGKISFGTTDDIGTRILPGVLAQFARSFPGVQVDVTITSSRENLDRIDSGSLDMGLVIIGNEGQEVRGEIIHTEPLVWAGREGASPLNNPPSPCTRQPRLRLEEDGTRCTRQCRFSLSSGVYMRKHSSSRSGDASRPCNHAFPDQFNQISNQEARTGGPSGDREVSNIAGEELV